MNQRKQSSKTKTYRKFFGLFAVLVLGFVLTFFSLTFPIPEYSISPSINVLNEVKKAGTSGSLVTVGSSSYWGFKNFATSEPNSSQHVFNLGSVSKQFTGFLLMQLEAEGKINHSAPIHQYLPELNDSKLGNATISNLSQMKSGLPYIESQMLKVLSQIQDRNWTQEEIIKEISQYRLLFNPGDHFEYSNLGYTLLGTIISRVEGKDLSVVLKERIFDPFGMKDTYLDYPEVQNSNRAKGYFMAFGRLIPMPNWNYSFLQGAGGVVSNVLDLEKWARGFMDFLNKNLKFKDALFGRRAKVTYDYGWDLSKKGLIRHSGETPGFCSYIAIGEFGSMAAYTINTDILLKDNSSIHKAMEEAAKQR